MLNTLYHTKEQIEQAEKIVNEEIIFDSGVSETTKDTYKSILIFCDFDKAKAAKHYKKLNETGFLLYSEVVSGGTDLKGWAL